MQGTGLPLATPFNGKGEIDAEKLTALVERVIEQGVDFIVPCGSNSEAELMTVEERTQVIEQVVDASTVPVMAGAGHPGYRETVNQIAAAAKAGADSVLVVTPFYYSHPQPALTEYYQAVADTAEIPVYLYSVPAYTGVELTPESVTELATHENIVGIKDSSGDLQNLKRIIERTPEDFDVLVGSGGIYAEALTVGADGGILALANVLPDGTAAIRQAIEEGELDHGCRLNRTAANLNHAITAEHGIPGLKAAMQVRDLPAGTVRRPFQPVDTPVRQQLKTEVQQTVARISNLETSTD